MEAPTAYEQSTFAFTWAKTTEHCPLETLGDFAKGRTVYYRLASRRRSAAMLTALRARAAMGLESFPVELDARNRDTQSIIDLWVCGHVRLVSVQRGGGTVDWFARLAK